jgi:hypothetical protein
MNGTVDCGAFLGRLQWEHHQINLELMKIRDQVATLGRGTSDSKKLAAIGEQLGRLVEHLKAHFADEEGGGCVAEVLDRCPTLAPQVQAMLTEHPQLLQSLEALTANVQRGQIAAEQLATAFETSAQALRTHEATENRLLQMALGGDAAEYDAEGNE